MKSGLDAMPLFLLDDLLSKEPIILSSPSACRTSGASKNPDSWAYTGGILRVYSGYTWVYLGYTWVILGVYLGSINWHLRTFVEEIIMWTRITSLLAHTVAQSTKRRFFPKNLSQLVIFVIGLAFTWV